MALVKFISGEGLEEEVEETSMAAEIMRNAGFRQIGNDGVPDAAAGEESGDLSKLTKKQLFDLAVTRDVAVTDKMSKAEIIAAIEAGPATGTDDGE